MTIDEMIAALQKLKDDQGVPGHTQVAAEFHGGCDSRPDVVKGFRFAQMEIGLCYMGRFPEKTWAAIPNKNWLTVVELI